jgi:excisionase family DNA binding protein
MSVKEFARHMKVSESTVRRLLGSGMPHMSSGSKGGGIRINASAAEAWMTNYTDRERAGRPAATPVVREARSGGTVFPMERRL